jgi:hypothetical protein
MFPQRLSRGVAVTIAVMIAAAPLSQASAQYGGGAMGRGGRSTRPIRFAFGGGVTVPTGDYKKAFENGVNGQGSIIINLGGLPIAFRGDLSYNRFSFRDRPEIVGLPTGPQAIDGTSQILGGLGNITIPISLGPITPYVMGGLGAFNMKVETDATGESASSTKFGVNGGAGIALHLFSIDAFVEGRLSNVYSSDTGVLDFKTVKFVPVTFGIIF